MIPSRFVWPLIFVTLLMTWVAVNWSAFTQVWWYTDDFARASNVNPLFSLGQGRPLEIFVPGLMHLAYVQQYAWLHQGMRLAQAILHIITALLFVRLLARLIDRWLVLSAGLFFIFWPFHGEAVLWLSAFAYPAAAAISLWGVLVINNGRFRRDQFHRDQLQNGYYLCYWVGSLLIIAAILVHQSAAVAGISGWVLFQALFVFKKDRLHPRWWQEGIVVIGSYIVGGLLSWGVIYLSLGDLGRAALPSSLTDKLYFWLELNRHYLASPHYPILLTMLQIVIIISALGMVTIVWRRNRLSWRQSTAAIGLLAALTLLPYPAVLMTIESSPAWRILYLAPLVTIAAWLILQELLSNSTPIRYISWSVIILFLTICIPINMRNAADYVHVFNADLEILDEIEQVATQQQLPPAQVVVATYPDYLRTWELHDVTYMHYDSKKSAFLRDWTVVPFLSHFSTLAPISAPGQPLVQERILLEQCVSLCRADGQQQPWQILPMPDDGNIMHLPLKLGANSGKGIKCLASHQRMRPIYGGLQRRSKVSVRWHFPTVVPPRQALFIVMGYRL